MLIPSIDLMGGKIVQLVQGEKKALEFDDFEPWLERFSKYPLIQLIDLDAAKGQGDNRQVLRSLLRRLPCQVGGGIRTAGDGTRDAGRGRAASGVRIVTDKGWEYRHCVRRASRGQSWRGQTGFRG